MRGPTGRTWSLHTSYSSALPVKCGGHVFPEHHYPELDVPLATVATYVTDGWVAEDDNCASKSDLKFLSSQ
jgi:hypothetical protein